MCDVCWLLQIKQIHTSNHPQQITWWKDLEWWMKLNFWDINLLKTVDGAHTSALASLSTTKQSHYLVQHGEDLNQKLCKLVKLLPPFLLLCDGNHLNPAACSVLLVSPAPRLCMYWR